MHGVISLSVAMSYDKANKVMENCSVYQSNIRVYPDSEFVVANTLAKWKKLEPNDINFSQGFSQKVVSTSFIFNSLPARADFYCLLITFANSLDPDQTRQNVGLIWIQTV